MSQEVSGPAPLRHVTGLYTVEIAITVFAREVKAHPMDQGRFLRFGLFWCPQSRWLKTELHVVEFPQRRRSAVCDLVDSVLNHQRVLDRNFDPVWSCRPLAPQEPTRGWELVADIMFYPSQFPELATKVAMNREALRYVAAKHFPLIAKTISPRSAEA